MDLKKIFNLVLSDFIKFQDAEKHTIRLGRYKEKIAIIDNGYRLFLIDEKRCPFKLDICGETFPVDKVIPNKSDYEDARRTNKLIELEKNTVVEIESVSGSVWVDNKLLKEFGDGLEFMTAKTTPEKRAVLIYKDNILIGLIMPIKKPTENKKG